MITAQASGHAVEDLSQRTEYGRVFANPDGSWTSDSTTEPERVQDDQGVWHDLDTDLVSRDGGLAPAVAATDVVFSDGGDKVFAAMTDDRGKRLEWRWPTILPAPVVDGDTVTYADALPGVGDLVVTATATGFTHNIVIPEMPADPVSVTIPVATRGAELVENPTGEVEIQTVDGDTLVAAARPLMWDSSENAGGDPVVKPIATDIGETASGVPTLILDPAESFLTNPDTVYPVVVDPSFTINPSGDTWVQTPNYTSSQNGSTELKVGTYDGGGHKARSFLKFDGGNSKWAGVKVLSADLKLRNYYSGSCTGSAIRVNRITESWSVSGITWGNQPSTGSMSADYNPAKGYTSSCAEGDATWDVTEIVQAWADGGANHGFRVKAVDETSIHTWRRYRSANYGTTGQRPRLIVSYNSYPAKAGKATVTPGNTGYATSTTPTLKSVVSDPDGGKVSGKFQVLNSSGTTIWSKTSSEVSSGGTATVSVPASAGLTNGSTYSVRVKGYDGSLSSKNWSASYSFTADTSTPAAPVVTATGYTNGEWLDTAPSSNTFTLNGVSDVGTLSYSKDGGAWTNLTANSNGNATLAWNPTSGYHTLKVKAIDKAGNTSGTTTFDFGVGGLAFSAPLAGGRSTGTFPVALSGKPNSTGAVLQWRYAGDTTWTDATEVTNTSGGAWNQTAPNDSTGAAAVTGPLRWDPTAEPAPSGGDPVTAPALLEIRGCFTYTTTPTQMCSSARRIQLVPSGFGGSMPTASVGPASVALTTGEFTLAAGDAADATVIGRVFSSFDVTTLTDGVFGPGWSSLIADPMTDAATATLLDDRSSAPGNAGPFVLQYPDGSTITFAPTGAAGAYAPVDTDAGSDTRTLTFDDNDTPSTTADDTVTLVEDQGATTTWSLASGAWLLTRVDGPQNAGVTTYSWDANKHLVWIGQDAPSGVTCTATTQQPGCRGLQLTYTGTGSSTRVASIAQVAYDPAPNANGLPGAGAGMTTTTVATYTYNVAGELTEVCDPRPATALCTDYTYAPIGGRTLLATMTPPGQTPWRFGYDTQGRLATVKRAVTAATGTGDATWTVAYDLSPSAAGLPDLSSSATEQWGQTTLPTQAAAVFSPDHVPTGAPDSSDWPYAQVWYATDDGTQTNTGVYGAGQWLLDTLWYDAQGNVEQTLDGAGRARALADPDPARRPTVAYEASTITIYNNDGDDDPTDGDGLRVTDEYGPAHTATLLDGSDGLFRPHTHYVYDDDTAGQNLDPTRPALPTGETSFGLVVEERHSAAVADLSADFDTRLVRYEYSPNATGDGNGWLLGMPTRTLNEKTGGGWTTAVTRFDTNGRILETRQPGGAASNGVGTDARSTTFVYYTADGSAADAECRNKPAWDGLPCRVGPAAQPAGNPMPVTYTLGYSQDSQPTRVEDRSGGTTRIKIVAYDGLGRPTSAQTTVTGGGSNDPTLPVTYYEYDGATGLPTTQTASGASVTTDYDAWGRPTSYTDALGNSSATTYTRASQVATFNDGAGTYAYSYDSATEHRGLPTSVDVGLATGPDVFTYAYNAAGTMSTVGYPNGTTATYGYDQAGAPVTLEYANGGEPLLAFAAIVDVDGRVLGYTSNASTQAYTYDKLGRLTKTEDSRDGGCTTRTYGFNDASERTGYASYAPAGDQSCQSSTATVSKANTYDTANRITNTGYTYDNLGRTQTTPAADTASGATGALTATYYPNDMIASLSQPVDDGAGGSTTKATTYSLDATGRVTSLANSTGGTEISRLRYRFAAPGDAPTSVDTSTNAGNTWTSTRYLQLPGLGMVAAVTGGSLELQLSDPSGNIAATQGAASTGVDSYSQTDEFGNQVDERTPERYTWQGSAMRSNDAVGGLVLMGVRLYSPATGSFLTKDPVQGGNATPYGYPTDPINSSDPSGACPVCIAIPIGIAIGDLIIALAAATVIAGVTIYAIETFRAHGYTVSMPNLRNKNKRDTNWKVYAIRYRRLDLSDTHWYIWKYGITGQSGDARPRSQLGTCQRLSKSPLPCRYEWRASGLNRYYARLVEANLIVSYLKNYGHCPPGHRGTVCH